MLVDKAFGIGLLGAVAQKLANDFFNEEEKKLFRAGIDMRNPLMALFNVGVNLLVDPPN
jgi:hypothetical protein